MAKRKKVHHHRPRRRRMSGLGHNMSNEFMEAVGLIGAAIIGPALQKTLVQIPMKIVSGAEAFIGWKMKSSSHPLMRGAGWGFFGTGIIGLTHEFGFIHGVEDFVNGLMDGDGQGAIEDEQTMRGLSNSSMMSGMSNSATMSGGGMEYSMDPIRAMM